MFPFGLGSNWMSHLQALGICWYYFDWSVCIPFTLVLHVKQPSGACVQMLVIWCKWGVVICLDLNDNSFFSRYQSKERLAWGSPHACSRMLATFRLPGTHSTEIWEKPGFKYRKADCMWLQSVFKKNILCVALQPQSCKGLASTPLHNLKWKTSVEYLVWEDLWRTKSI